MGNAAHGFALHAAELAEKLRRAAGCVKAEDFLRIDFDARHGRDGDRRMQIGNDRDLRRLAHGLEQEFADFAGMRIRGRTIRRDDRSGRIVVVVVVLITASIGVRVRCIDSNMRAVVMMLILRRQQMQTLAQQRNADISRQQRGGQKVAES